MLRDEQIISGVGKSLTTHEKAIIARGKTLKSAQKILKAVR
jgi:hypothetical protein